MQSLTVANSISGGKNIAVATLLCQKSKNNQNFPPPNTELWGTPQCRSSINQGGTSCLPDQKRPWWIDLRGFTCYWKLSSELVLLFSFCTDDKWHFILFIHFYYFWPHPERYCSHPIPVPSLFCPVTLFSVYLHMYDYKYIAVKWICTVWRGLCIYGEDSGQSQNRGRLSVHASTSKGLTLARYSAYVFSSRFALPTVLGQSSPPLKRYSTVNTVCTVSRWVVRMEGR